LLLTDMIMPEMNGMELAAKVLAKRPGLHILYASGHAGSEFVQDASADALHFLPKPFTAQSLIAKIREVLLS
jgi:two-component system, cell cycle sensor histidine kinase and response regulator CckA